MRKLIFILFWLISIFANATTWYVANDGNDGGAGTIGDPWLTWEKAFTSASVQAGDTVYFRGGVYPTTVTNGIGIPITRDGTITDTLCYFNYPGEVPILDFSNIVSTDDYQWGIRATGVHYVKFKGLTFRNMIRQTEGYEGYLIDIELSEGVVLENCVAYNAWGEAFEARRNTSIYYINCDAHTCCDTVPRAGGTGERGTGFHIQNTDIEDGESYYINCRAWNCSDQGFAFYDVGYIEAIGCWSWGNGGLEAGGHGIKIGFTALTEGTTELKRKVINFVAAYNRSSGITTNLNKKHGYGMQVYNNIAYHNGYYDGWPPYIRGFVVYNTLDADEVELAQIFKNNVSYANEYQPIYVQSGALYTHSNNSWDSGLTLTDADFLSVDSTGITAPRQADGSFPDNDCYNYFLHLASTSDLIDAGTELGYGDDIGAFQYEETGVEPLVVFTTTVYPHTDWALAGGNVYDDGGGSIDARGVCWSESENPTIADSHTSDGTGTGVYSSTLTGLSEGTTYHARAYAHNEVGYGYGADVEFETLILGGGETIVFHNVKMIFHNGKIIVH